MATETFVISASGKASISKDPNATLDYTFDWTDWLASADEPDDTIASVAFAIAGTTATIGTVTNNSTTATAWISGGVVGEKAALSCKITTVNAPARVEERTVYIKIKER